MFENKKNGAAAPGTGPQLPSGVQMFLKTLGFDPNAVMGQMGSVADQVKATELRFGAKLDGISWQLGVLMDVLSVDQAAIAAPILAAIAHEARRRDQQFMELAAAFAKMQHRQDEQWLAVAEGMGKLHSQMAEVIKCQKTQKPRK